MSLKSRFLLWGIGVVFFSAFLGARWHLFLSHLQLGEFWEIVLTLVPFLLLLIVPLWVALERWIFRRLERISLSNKQVGKGNLAAGFIAEESEKRDEIGELIESRNAMLSLIESHQKEIEEGKLKAEELQQQILKEQVQLQTTMAHLPSGVLLLDGEKRLLLLNPEAEQFLSYLKMEKQDGKVVRMGGLPIEEILKSREEGDALEICVLQPEKRTFVLESHSVASRGEDRGWVLVIRDVTLEREQLNLAQKQERLAAVGQLAAGIAHDFNNILTGIIGTAQVLLLEEKLPESIGKEIEEVEKLGRRAAQLIRQVLDFSRKSVENPQVFDLIPFLKEMGKLWKRTFPESIKIDFSFEREKFPVMGNPAQIEQVMMNLAINARDAMPEGGTLLLRVSSSTKRDRALFSKEQREGEWGLIEVRDTGTGMTEEVQKHIFEPFFTTKKRGEGTGLGLAQVYGIVKQHRGLVRCESVPGEGTAFFIHLPLAEGKKAELERDEKGIVRGNGETLLLVEDEAQTRKTVQKMLEDIGYRVLTARDGEEGLRLFQEKADDIDGILTDVVMPKMGGEKLIAELRKIDPALPIVAVSGYPLEEKKKDYGSERAKVWFVQKPPALEELSCTLRNALQKKKRGAD